jgi:hypothetical protein
VVSDRRDVVRIPPIRKSKISDTFFSKLEKVLLEFKILKCTNVPTTNAIKSKAFEILKTSIV